MRRLGRPSLLVSLVTHNDERFLERCLESLSEQSLPLRIKVLDNASGDGTAAIARRRGVELVQSPANLGYCGGHNWNLKGERFDYVLLLNADVLLSPDYAESLISEMSRLDRVGSAGGKLFRLDSGGRRVRSERGPLLDSTGIYFTPAQRHFDRGSQQGDRGQFERMEFVFGITGAALLCSREFVDDVAVESEFLDEDFFAYREDADLAWRGQLKGWRSLYLPAAVGGHVRRVFPGGRRQANPIANYHSVKNRFLMRQKNIDPAVSRRCFPFMQLRDLAIFGYIHTRERATLPALREVECLKPRTLEKRRLIQSSRRVSGETIAAWFSFKPVAYPVSATIEGSGKSKVENRKS